MFTLLQTTCTHHWADCLRFKPSLKIHTFQSSENRINVCALKDHCSWES
uniref:Uncharacterized protein n=2 Tax=Anguilla anguilla TaxID=7936 RepID=A0A0E9PQM1_ANGAN